MPNRRGLMYLDVFFNFKHCLCIIFKFLTKNTNVIADFSTSFLSIITGVSIISGLRYIKSLKEKTTAATFTFWSQLSMRMRELLIWLKADYSLLDNLFSPESRRQWEIISTESDELEKFVAKVESTISFIENSPDQMPAYIGWTNDYNCFTEFLYDIIKYDIRDSDHNFKFSEFKGIEFRNQYCNNICIIMERLCKGINERQESIEKELFK